jgi:hypothetical protein
MELKVKLTNSSASDNTYVWPRVGRIFLSKGETKIFPMSSIPDEADINRYQGFTADLEAGNIKVVLLTDLPVERIFIKKEKAVTKQDVENMMQKEVVITQQPTIIDRPEQKLDKSRFVEGKVEDFRADTRSMDNDEGKPLEPITVNIFKEDVKLPDTIELFKDSADAEYRKTSENIFAPRSIKEALDDKLDSMSEGPMEAMKKQRGRKKKDS